MANKFTVKSANDLYLESNNLCSHVIVKITKADKTNIDANTTALINLTLHSMFCKIWLKFNGSNVGDISRLYPSRLALKRLLNFCKEVQKNSFPKRGIYKRHSQAHECHLIRLEQCRVERSRRDICEKYPSQAHRSHLPGHFSL